MTRPLAERVAAKHKTAVARYVGDVDAPTAYRATCVCGWHWANRFTRQAADGDAATHLSAVQMFAQTAESRALARRANTTQRGS